MSSSLQSYTHSSKDSKKDSNSSPVAPLGGFGADEPISGLGFLAVPTPPPASPVPPPLPAPVNSQVCFSGLSRAQFEEFALMFHKNGLEAYCVLDSTQNQIKIKPEFENACPEKFASIIRQALLRNIKITQNMVLNNQEYEAQLIGQGGFHRVYRVMKEGEDVAIKISRYDDSAQERSRELAAAERALRLLSEMTPSLNPALIPCIFNGRTVNGLELVFLKDFRQATDVEVALALIDIYRRHGRVVLDAHIRHNVVVSRQTGEVLLIDVDYAARRDSIVSVNFFRHKTMETFFPEVQPATRYSPPQAERHILIAVVSALGQALWDPIGNFRAAEPIEEELKERANLIKAATGNLLHAIGLSAVCESKDNAERKWEDREERARVSVADLERIFQALMVPFPPSADGGLSAVDVHELASAGEFKRDTPLPVGEEFLAQFFHIVLTKEFNSAHDIKEQIHLMHKTIQELSPKEKSKAINTTLFQNLMARMLAASSDLQDFERLFEVIVFARPPHPRQKDAAWDPSDRESTLINLLLNLSGDGYVLIKRALAELGGFSRLYKIASVQGGYLSLFVQLPSVYAGQGQPAGFQTEVISEVLQKELVECVDKALRDKDLSKEVQEVIREFKGRLLSHPAENFEAFAKQLYQFERLLSKKAWSIRWCSEGSETFKRIGPKIRQLRKFMHLSLGLHLIPQKDIIQSRNMENYGDERVRGVLTFKHYGHGRGPEEKSSFDFEGKS